MDAYTGFAEVYDMFMDNIPYETWCEYLTGLLKEQGVTEGMTVTEENFQTSARPRPTHLRCMISLRVSGPAGFGEQGGRL